jgi:tRNA (cmo5U34)-methyltransferase
MSYKESRWADPEFSGRFASNADNIILERQRLIGVLKSFYGHFLAGREHVDALDLGCGDGTLAHELMKEFPNFSVMLIDGSEDMLKKAKEGLHGKRVEFLNASFQEIIGGKHDLPEFDFIFSSLAIHHLTYEEKEDLYAYIRDSLKAGGYFVNIDAVLPPSEELEEWYLDVWREWADKTGSEERLDPVAMYKENQDNKPDTLQSQLDMLSRLGFKSVDCYYKNGIFAIFGGGK